MNGLAGMRILMTSDTIGGVWSYATSLSTALAAMGAEIHLVTMGPPARADQRVALRGTDIRLIETDLALEWQDAEASDLAHARAVLLGLERQLRPDIVHLNSFREATFGWRAPVVLVAHSCVNSWARACDDTDFLSEPLWQRYGELIAKGLASAAAWVAPTCAFGETIARIHTPPRPGLAIWNGVGSMPSQIARKENFILAAGRMWDRAKNLAALDSVADDVPAPIYVAGAHAEADDGRCSLRVLGELPQAELRQWMSRAAIFASPARYEPFGLAVLEAASAGCALVLADIPTFRELWQDAAVFVAPDDTAALTSMLAWISNDERARKALQRAAHQRARRYTLHEMAAQYSDLYLDLFGRQTSHHFAEACA
jgi:glycosyltransferase involved in cell wall biosynthesis